MNDELNKIFSQIYVTKKWGDGSILKPLSGGGSNPNHAKPYVDFVRQKINDLEVQSVLDVGHGDWAMWRDYRFEDTFYTGVDVVAGLSETNHHRFGTKNVVFLEHNSNQDLPIAELLISKDVLQHLSLGDIDDLMLHFSRYKYLILCNDIAHYKSLFSVFRFSVQIKKRITLARMRKSPFRKPRFPNNNSEIFTGGWRPIDLQGTCFQNRLEGFILIETLDYGIENFNLIKKRIYFFKKIDN